MTTNDLLWNTTFETESNNEDFSYSYQEERNMEQYYKQKELFERLTELLKPAI